MSEQPPTVADMLRATAELRTQWMLEQQRILDAMFPPRPPTWRSRLRGRVYRVRARLADWIIP